MEALRETRPSSELILGTNVMAHPAGRKDPVTNHATNGRETTSTPTLEKLATREFPVIRGRCVRANVGIGSRYTPVGQSVRKGRHLGEDRDDSHARQPAQ
jgi:hypothetical protein